MLTLHIITVGKDKDSWVSEQIAHYCTQLKKYARVEISTVAEAKYTKNTDLHKALAAEANAIEEKLRGGYLVVLDVTGKTFSTEALAGELTRLQVSGVSTIEWVIGGPFGLDERLKKKADLRFSLSPLTMSHQIVRLVLLEQLFRVLNLNAGGSYHK
jgi:23S rRNA (pseudouridine1915-N3)-methyltransferase